MLVSNRNLVHSGTVTATGTTTPIQLTRGRNFLARLNAVNDAGSSPTLDVALQHAPTNDGTFSTFATFAQATTGTSVQNIPLNSFDSHIFPFVRASYTIGGSSSPSYTVTLDLYSDE